MRRLLCSVLLLFLAGCGYHFSAQTAALPEGMKTVYLPLFENASTEPRLEVLLYNAVHSSLSRQAHIKLIEKREQADAVVEGIIRSYSSRPLAYNSQDEISEYRAVMGMTARLRRNTDGKLLWSEDLSWSAEYSAADDKAVQENLERSAIEEINHRLADELAFRLLHQF